MEIPLGNPGSTSHDTTSPPMLDGVCGVINSPTVSVNASDEYPTDGTIAITERLNSVITEPPELFAQTVYCVTVHSSVGVPEISPVD